jgi:lipid A 4'-phosphatase
LLIKMVRPTLPMLIPGRAVIFLVLTFALGPGLLVNGILKEYWSRPRPAEVMTFGGDKAFVAWWDPRGTCDQNCSFVSGETSMAAWTFAPAVLIPGPLGAIAIGAATLFTLGMATMRLIAGGHFFTDVAFAILFTLLIVWTMHGMIYRWPRTKLDENTIENALAGVGLFIRNEVLAPVRNYSYAVMRILQRRNSDIP